MNGALQFDRSRWMEISGGTDMRPRVRRRAVAAASRPVPSLEPLEGRMLFAVTLVSANALGQAGATGVRSFDAEVSSDGRYVVYATDQTDVVTGVADTNAKPDVYVRDLTTAGPAVLVSGGVNNVAFGGNEPSISADGRYVAFTTESSLVAADANGTANDVYVWDRQAPGAFTLVSVGTSGAAAGGFLPSISNSGRLVAFVSSTTAASFQAGATDANAGRDVFVRNLDANTTVLASAAPGGTAAGNISSDGPMISGDGATVVFVSAATNLTATPTSGGDEAYRRVLTSPNVELVSIATPGGVPTGGGNTSTVSVSDDGNLVAFSSGSTDIVINDTNGVRDAFVRNMSAGLTNVVSTSAAGDLNNANAAGPWISGDGVFVAFHSNATNLVTPDPGTSDVFLKNLTDGSIRRISQTDPGAELGNFGSSFASVSANGAAVAFISQATNLAPNTEPPTETDDDVFAYTAVPPTPPDTTAPTATIAAAHITAAGAPTHAVSVVYNDNTAVSVAGIGADDITVTGPGGVVTVTGVSVTPNTDAASLTAVYTLAAPGGTWDFADNGTYTITLPAGAVTDAAGNPVAAGTGNFSVTIVPPTGPGPDLVVSQIIAGPKGLPPSVIGGSRGNVRVRITNQGDQLASGTVAVALLARDVDPVTAATGDTAIITTPARRIRLKPGQSRFVPVRFSYPSLPAAAYSLVAAVDPGNALTEGNEFNNETASATAITIAPAFVDLAATGVGTPTRGSIAIGRRTSVPVTIQNLGNSPATGLLKIDLYASTTGDTIIDAGDILIGTVSKRLRLKNGQSRVIRINVPVDAALSAGQYFVTAVINNPAAIAETSAANNTAVSPTAFPAA